MMVEAVFVALLICGITLPLGLVQAVVARRRAEWVWGADHNPEERQCPASA